MAPQNRAGAIQSSHVGESRVAHDDVAVRRNFQVTDRVARQSRQKPGAEKVAGRVNALRNWRDQQVKKLAIDPALICTKSIISEIALQKPGNVSDLAKIKGLKNWQRKEFGLDILEVLKQVR